jgi:hypothetical protein
MSQPPPPGSPEDIQDMKEIRSSYESLPVVAELRANPDFEELGANTGEEMSEEEKAGYLTAGAMGGSRGLAVQVCWSFIFYPSLPQSGGRIHIVSLTPGFLEDLLE